MENDLSEINDQILALFNATIYPILQAQLAAAEALYLQVILDPNSTELEKAAARLIFDAALAAIQAAEDAAIISITAYFADDIAAAFAKFALCELSCDPDNVPDPNPVPVPDPNP